MRSRALHVSRLPLGNDPTFQTQGNLVDSTGLLGTGPWSGTSNFPTLNGITGTGPTVVVGNGNASVEGLSTESNGQPIRSFGAIFQTLNTNYTANTVYTLTLNIAFNVPLSANPLTVDNLGIALTAGGSQISPGSNIASSLAPNASTVVTATPGSLAENVTLQYTNGNSMRRNAGRENSEGQVKYCRCTFFGHATPDRAGARPLSVRNVL